MLTQEQVIQTLQLKPLPEEGGFYRETYRSDWTIPAHQLSSHYDGKRNVSTAIYYFVTPESFSFIHRVPSDEIFHFYLGDPVEMFIFPNTFSSVQRIVLGQDILSGEQPQVLAPGNDWQGTRLVEGGRWALLGTTVAPGFDFKDFELPCVQTLSYQYPDYKQTIESMSPSLKN